MSTFDERMVKLDELMVQVIAILPTATMELDSNGQIVINTNLTFADDDGNVTEMA